MDKFGNPSILNPYGTDTFLITLNTLATAILVSSVCGMELIKKEALTKRSAGVTEPGRKFLPGIFSQYLAIANCCSYGGSLVNTTYDGL